MADDLNGAQPAVPLFSYTPDDGNQFNRNLMAFGQALMAAGGRPGATTLGAIGEAGQTASAQALKNAELQRQWGLQQAQTGLLQQQTQHARNENQIDQMNIAGYQALQGGGTPQYPGAVGGAPSMYPANTAGANLAAVDANARPTGVQPPPSNSSTGQTTPPAGGAFAKGPETVTPRAPSAGGMGVPAMVDLGTLWQKYQAMARVPVLIPQAMQLLQEIQKRVPPGMQLGQDGQLYNMPGYTGAMGAQKFAESQGQAQGAFGSEAALKRLQTGLDISKEQAIPHPTNSGNTVYNPADGFWYAQRNPVPSKVMDTVQGSPTFGQQIDGLYYPPPERLTGPGAGPAPGGSGGGGQAAPVLRQGGAVAGAPQITPTQPTSLPPTQGANAISDRFNPIGPSELPPASYEQQKEIGIANGEMIKADQKAYNANASVLGQLAAMQGDLKKLDTNGRPNWLAPGTGLDARNSIANTINSAAKMAGLPDKDLIQGTKDVNEFQKEAVRLSMQLLNANFGAARESAFNVDFASKGIPNLEQAGESPQNVINTLTEAARRGIDRYQYAYGEAKKGGDYASSLSKFDSVYTPESYVNRALSQTSPIVIQDPNQADSFLPGTKIVLNGKNYIVPKNSFHQFYNSQFNTGFLPAARK